MTGLRQLSGRGRSAEFPRLGAEPPAERTRVAEAGIVNRMFGARSGPIAARL